MDPTSYAHTVHKTSVPSPHSYALSGKIMLSAIIILFSVVLFILFLHFYVRWHVLRRATRRASRRNRRLHFAGENQSPSATKALDPAILNSLPVLLFSPVPADDGELDECDCAVCLTEFEEGQKIRSLPPCGHCFHVDCIDMWFVSHSNCPLCRAAVEAVPSDLCLQGEEVGSSSSDSGEGEFAVEGLGGEGERVVFGRALKWPINRIVLFRRLFGLSEAVLDLEEGGGQAAARPPPAV